MQPFSTQFFIAFWTSENILFERWNKDNLWEKVSDTNEGSEQFVVHDGPPYANGPIHLGHAVNKVLKDVLVKFKRMQGFHCPFRPGWDCHGLPIEYKVAEELGIKKNDPEFPPNLIRKHCRTYAQKWVNHQSEEFRRLGVFADWSHPYLTMDHSYEADTLRVFGKFVERGLVHRKSKTVPWCPRCRTTLSKAETEYAPRQDPSCYVLFRLTDDALVTLRKVVPAAATMDEVSLVAWTTTPWTLPMNRALAVNPTGDYVLVRHLRLDPRCAMLVGGDFLHLLAPKLGLSKTPVGTVTAEFFRNHVRVHHPLEQARTVPVVVDPFVVLRGREDDRFSGGGLVPSGVVHVAPGCGVEDYKVAATHGLEMGEGSSVNKDGCYEEGVYPEELVGKSVVEFGQQFVLRKILSKKNLLYLEQVVHEYPHCWRCKGPLLFRATQQWFCDLDKSEDENPNFRENPNLENSENSSNGPENYSPLLSDTLRMAENVYFVPPSAKQNFFSFASHRDEWCISRQRAWGVPLVALHCGACHGAYTTGRIVDHVARGVETRGLDYWDEVTVVELVPNCPHCGNSEPELFTKETDVLDVWFDSGISNFSVLAKSGCKNLKKRIKFPCDVYLEGKDQHRGWFQSSFLCSMVALGQLPTQTVIAHGFLVDEFGRKYSKSFGNGITPESVRKKYNTDVLRLWCCSFDFTKDMCVSEKTLESSARNYRKFRSTLRFLLANLVDFNPDVDLFPFDRLLLVDQCLLATATDLLSTVLAAVDRFDIFSATNLLVNFCRNTLSSFYFETIKPRLYFELPQSILRLSAQNTCHHLLTLLTRLLAPVVSFLGEEAFLVSREGERREFASVHLSQLDQVMSYGWPEVAESRGFTMDEAKRSWGCLLGVKGVINRMVEEVREKGIVNASQEVRVKLTVDVDREDGKELAELMCVFGGEELMADFFLVTQFSWKMVHMREQVEVGEEVWEEVLPVCVELERMGLRQCYRCRRFSVEEGHLCVRCHPIVDHIGLRKI